MPEDRERIPTPEEFEAEKNATPRSRWRRTPGASVAETFAPTRRLRRLLRLDPRIGARKRTKDPEDLEPTDTAVSEPGGGSAASGVPPSEMTDADLEGVAGTRDPGSSSPEGAKRIRRVTIRRDEPPEPRDPATTASVIPPIGSIPEPDHEAAFRGLWDGAHLLGHRLGDFTLDRPGRWIAVCRKCGRRAILSIEVDGWSSKNSPAVPTGRAVRSTCPTKIGA